MLLIKNLNVLNYNYKYKKMLLFEKSKKSLKIMAMEIKHKLN